MSDNLQQEDITFTREDVARMFKVTEFTVDNWRKAGIISAIKVGRSVRFTKQEVERLLQQHGTDNAQH